MERIFVWEGWERADWHAESATVLFGDSRMLATGTQLGIDPLPYSLNYSLAVGADSQSDDAGSGGRNHSYTVTGTMAAGQAGDSSAATGPNTHTLTITY